MVRSRDNAVVSDRWPYRRALAAIAALGLVAAVGSLCFFTVDSADYAIVTDFGKPTQVITAPGLRFKHPLQGVRTFDRRLFVYAAPPSEFLTLEKTPVVASGTILWRVADPKRYFETVIDRRGAESRLGDILSAEFGAAIGSNHLVAFVSTDPAAYRADAIVAEIARRCGAVAQRDYGIDVVDEPLRVHPLIGYTSDFFSLYEDLLVWEYLDHFARCYGIMSIERRSKLIDEVLSLALPSSAREEKQDAEERDKVLNPVG
jgi:membrane protease subunit HflC